MPYPVSTHCDRAPASPRIARSAAPQMSYKTLCLLPFAFCLLLPARAQTQPATPATTNYANLQIQITGVEGNVQVRDAEDKPWRKAKEGDSVNAGAEFRTGPRSAVRCSIPP